MDKRKDKGQAPGRDKPRPVRYSHPYRTSYNPPVIANQCPMSLVWQSVLLDLCAGVLRIPTTSLRTGLGMTRKFFRLPSLRGRNAPVAIRSPVPSAPLPKGGWHGKAVTGGFSRRTALLITPRPVITPSEKIPTPEIESGVGIFILLSASFVRPKRFAG